MAFIDSRMVNGPDGKNVFDSLNDHASSLADKATDITKLQNKTKWIDPIKDYNCVGDGVTDDSVNFQAALNACVNGSIVVIPQGVRFLITQPLTINAGYVTIKSDVDFHGVADGNTYATGFIFKLPANSVAITTSKKLTLIGVFAQEQGIANGCTFLSISTDIHAFNCQFYDWSIGNSVTTSYYSKFNNCEWVTCGTGVKLTSSYNVHFVTPKFSCNIAIDAGSGCKPVSIFGGSIESFTTAGIKMATNTQVNVYGVYWESSSATGNFGIVTSSGSQLNLWGNYVFLNNLNRWVNSSGQTSVSINSKGNYFAGSSSSSVASPQAYVLPSSGNVDISGDDWNEVVGLSAVFINSNMNLPNFRITPPMNGGYQPIQYQGNDSILVAHTAVPTGLKANTLYLADGVTWDPLTKSYGRPYLVLYTGSAWVSVS